MSTSSLRQRKSEHGELLDAQSPHEEKKEVNKHWKMAFNASTVSYRMRSYCIKSRFRIDRKTLNDLLRDQNLALLQQLGGVDAIARKLRTNADHGIDDDDEDIRCRRETFGANMFKSPPKIRLFHFLLQASLKFKVLVLIICGALSLGFGLKVEGSEDGWKDGAGIFIGVLFSILFVAMSEYWHDGLLQQSQQNTKNIKMGVVRGGRQKQIPIFEVVVGDVVCLKRGDHIPAHGLLFDGTNSPQLQLNEARDHQVGATDHEGMQSNLTGNSAFLVSGAKVAEGFGRMLVTSVGMDATQSKSETNFYSGKESPLQLKAQLQGLDRIKVLFSILSYGLTIGAFVLILRGLVTLENGEPLQGIARIKELVELLVGIITALNDISDHWELSLKCTRAYAMKKLMAHNKAIVLNPSSLETLGCATIICTAGFLTMYEMQVDRLWLGKEPVAKGTCLSLIADQNVIELLREGIALNIYSTASTSGSEFEVAGPSTEKAVLSWAIEDLKMDMEKEKRSHDILPIEAFNSEEKLSGILVKRKVDNTMQMHWKGAAELILKMCSSYYDGYGNTIVLDHDKRTELEKSMEDSCLRCIAFAHKTVSLQQFLGANRDEMLKDGLILLGFVSVSNRCYPGVKKVVEKFQNAGVKIQMITGDDIISAEAIATECGILTCDRGKLIEAVDFRNSTAKQRKEMADEICVMASASPYDKHLLIQCLNDKDHIVAVTGDNIKDIEALKAANIGLFLGVNQHTKVAKEGSDIIISDGNLAYVFKALKWGRCVYSNVQKFVQFQLAVTIATLVATVFSSQGLPLSAVQWLWVSLVTDSLGSLAFATEKPTKEEMEKPPVPCKTEPIVTNVMLRNILPQTMYQVALLLTLPYLHHIPLVFGVNDKVKNTIIFNSYVLCQVFNELNSRKLEKKNILANIHSSKLFLGVVATTIALQIFLVEFLKNFADTESLNWSQRGFCVGFAAMTLPIGLAARCIYIRDKPFISRMLNGRIKGWTERRIFAKLRSLSTWTIQVFVGMRRNSRGGLLLPVTRDAPSHG